MKKLETVDEYIADAADNVQAKLRELRTIITALAPEAEEKISYGIPAYHLNGPLVYFGGFKHHVSLFATASKLVKEKFHEELAPYIRSKGTIQFPLDESLPRALIEDIVKTRIEENQPKKK